MKAVFDHPVIGRCQLHKIRNVQNHLPDHLASTVAKKMRAAYHDPNALHTEATLEAIVRDPQRSHPGAAASLREGLAETLTVTRLGVPPTMARTLQLTSVIESVIEIGRDHSANVKGWRDGQMALRWCAAGMLKATKQFRTIGTARWPRSHRASCSAHVDGPLCGQSPLHLAPTCLPFRKAILEPPGSHRVTRSSGPACSISCSSTSLTYCSATGCACSTQRTRMPSSSPRRESSIRPMSPTSATRSTGRRSWSSPSEAEVPPRAALARCADLPPSICSGDGPAPPAAGRSLLDRACSRERGAGHPRWVHTGYRDDPFDSSLRACAEASSGSCVRLDVEGESTAPTPL